MTDQDTRDHDDVTTAAPSAFVRDRRAVLKTAGMVTLAGAGTVALAACSPSSTSTPTTAPATTAAPESSAPASSPSASSSSSSSASAASGPSVATSDVPSGSGVILQDADYVVTQPSAGEYKAFTAICTHQQCKVSEMRGDKIHCGCHGSEFSITDGSVTQGPANEPLKEFKTSVSGSKVVIQA